jgi:dihydrodipicolinate reductase
MVIKVCLAGATGWAGSELARAIAKTEGFALIAAVSRTHAGLVDEDFAEIDVEARKQQLGVLACGNFALTAVLMQKFAETAAKLIPQWEIIDYAHDDKVDAIGRDDKEI